MFLSFKFVHNGKVVIFALSITDKGSSIAAMLESFFSVF